MSTMPVRSQWRRHHAAECRHHRSGSHHSRRWSGTGVVDLLHEPGAGDAHRAARFHEPGEVVQVQVVRAVVEERVDRHDGVEELRGERQRAGIGVDREDAVLDAGVPDALQVLRGAEPQVGGPDLHAELAAQEDRRRRASTAEIQHPHAGPQVERLGQPLGQPQRVGPAAGTRRAPTRGGTSRRGGIEHRLSDRSSSWDHHAPSAADARGIRRVQPQGSGRGSPAC